MMKNELKEINLLILILYMILLSFILTWLGLRILMLRFLMIKESWKYWSIKYTYRNLLIYHKRLFSY